MSSDDDRVRSTEEWNRLDRGEIDDADHEESGRDPLRKADSAEDAATTGAGSEPPD
jgi:hypothetical protein